MRRSNNVTTFSLMVLCAILSLAGTDLVLPVVPQLPNLFSTDEATAQLVLAAYVGGSGIGLLLFGQLADHFERKPLMVVSLIAFALTSIGCALAPNINVLIALRLLQGAAAAAAPVFGPGVIRQLFDDRTAVRAVGFLGSAETIAPALAPILGVALLTHFGWASSFRLLAVLNAITAVLIVVIGLPRQERSSSPRGSYFQLLTDRVFMRYALSQAMTLGGLIVFVFGAPTVITATMGGSLNDFMVMQVINVSGFIVAANLTARIAERFGTERIIFLGTALAAASGLGLLVYGLVGGTNTVMLPILFTPMAVGLGLRGPIGFYRGIVASGDNNARGSALIVFFIFLVTTIGTLIAAPFITQGLAALSLVVSGILIVAVLVLLLLPRMKELPPTYDAEGLG